MSEDAYPLSCKMKPPSPAFFLHEVYGALREPHIPQMGDKRISFISRAEVHAKVLERPATDKPCWTAIFPPLMACITAPRPHYKAYLTEANFLTAAPTWGVGSQFFSIPSLHKNTFSQSVKVERDLLQLKVVCAL